MKTVTMREAINLEYLPAALRRDAKQHRGRSPGMGRAVAADPQRQCPCGRWHQRQGAGLLCGDCEIAALVARRRR